MNELPFQVGEKIDDVTVQHVETLGPGIHFIGTIEGYAAIQISPEAMAKIPEPWRSAFPYFRSGWIEWNLPKPRGRRKAA